MRVAGCGSEEHMIYVMLQDASTVCLATTVFVLLNGMDVCKGSARTVYDHPAGVARKVLCRG